MTSLTATSPSPTWPVDGAAGDRADRGLDLVVLDEQRHEQLVGDEHLVGVAAVLAGLLRGPAVAPHVADGEAVQAGLAEQRGDLAEPLGTDDRFDALH